MTRPLTARLSMMAGLIAVLPLLVTPLVPAQSVAERKQEARLKKKLARLDAEIARQDKRLAKTKERCRAEYAKLRDPAQQKELAGLLDTIREKYSSDLSSGRLKRKVLRSLTKDVKSAIASSIGPNLAKALTETIRDEFLAACNDEKYDAAKVLARVVEDVFTGDFDADFESEIKRLLISPAGAKLRRERKQVQQELAELQARIEARQSGLPYGMVLVDGGEYTVGVTRKDLERFAKKDGTDLQNIHLVFRSWPAQKVKIDPFLIDRNEVTCEAYYEFLKDTGFKNVPKYWDQNDNKYWEGFDKRPVTGITWHDARTFARWVGRRLPTEFEWEVAARMGRDSKHANFFTWGDNPPDEQLCNYNALFEHPQRRLRLKGVKVIPPVMRVGSFPKGANPVLGIYDMCGNAAEYTSSPFVPYKGFKTIKVGKRTVSTSDFSDTQIVVRGGHGLNDRDIVTTFWRLGARKNNKYECVGFRTAASPVRGKDHLAAIFESGEYKIFLIDYPLLPSDVLEGRKAPELALDDSDRYTALMAGGWNAETGLPERARFISILNRKADDFRNLDALNSFVGPKGEPILLGFMHTDLKFKEPAIEPGDYLVLWEPRHQETIAPEEDESGDTPASADDQEKKGKKEKKAKKKGGKKAEPQVVQVPDRVIFYNVRKPKDQAVKMSMETFPPTVSRKQPTMITQASRDGDGVDLFYAFPIRHKSNKCFVIRIPLKTEKGETSAFK